MLSKLRVGLIFGGKSGEHEVSIVSARSVLRAMDKSRYVVIPIAVTKEGKWLPPAHSFKLLVSGDHGPNSANNEKVEKELKDLVSTESAELALTVQNLHESATKIDVAFPLLHGPFGEDGTAQGLLELADIPYVGAGVLASALGMDKSLMKTVFLQHNLPVVPYTVILRRRWDSQKEEVLKDIENNFAYPCFVKPTNLGSSVGISKAHNRDELIRALDEAASLDRKILVEEAIPAREIECSVLGNDEPVASPLGEIVPSREFYDYEAKYNDERTQLIIPADLPYEKADYMRDLAVRAFKAIDCAGMARVDFFLHNKTGQVYVSEINTIPGFTQVSMYPKLWEACSIPYPELIDKLIELAMERYKDKKRNRRTTASE